MSVGRRAFDEGDVVAGAPFGRCRLATVVHQLVAVVAGASLLLLLLLQLLLRMPRTVGGRGSGAIDDATGKAVATRLEYRVRMQQSTAAAMRVVRVGSHQSDAAISVASRNAAPPLPEQATISSIRRPPLGRRR